MAKFLNTSGTNYYLEELIKGAKDRLILISPYLRLNDRIKELLEDKNRLKIDVRIVYGKSELQPVEVNWLKPYLTDLGTSIGGEYRRAYGGYFLWPQDLFASACTQAIDGTVQQLGC